MRGSNIQQNTTILNKITIINMYFQSNLRNNNMVLTFTLTISLVLDIIQNKSRLNKSTSQTPKSSQLTNEKFCLYKETNTVRK